MILNPRRKIDGIADSKQLDGEEREELSVLIKQRSIAWSVAWADVAEIDSLNILQATFLAMRRALCGLRVAPVRIQVDGNRAPSVLGIGFTCNVETIVQGDALVECIGAASIIAKTTRDQMMCRLHEIYPDYGFAGHKGYGTPAHYRALDRHGPCPIHRRSFGPVREAYEREGSESFAFSFTGAELDEESQFATSEE